MSDKLKPCPFCGGLAEYISEFSTEAVFCSVCPAAIEDYSCDKNELIEAWNKRTEHREG